MIKALKIIAIITIVLAVLSTPLAFYVSQYLVAVLLFCVAGWAAMFLAALIILVKSN